MQRLPGNIATTMDALRKGSNNGAAIAGGDFIISRKV